MELFFARIIIKPFIIRCILLQCVVHTCNHARAHTLPLCPIALPLFIYALVYQISLALRLHLLHVLLGSWSDSSTSRLFDSAPLTRRPSRTLRSRVRIAWERRRLAKTSPLDGERAKEVPLDGERLRTSPADGERACRIGEAEAWTPGGEGCTGGAGAS